MTETVTPAPGIQIFTTVPSASPGSRELGSIILDDSPDASVMSKVYTFLYGLNKQKLRSVCKRIRCRLAGNKQELLFRAYLFLANLDEQIGDVVSFMSSRSEFDGAKRFFADNEFVTLNLQTVPSKAFMLEHLKASGDKVNETNLATATAAEGEPVEKQNEPNFSHSEFARLVLIMRDDESAKEALFALSQELQRPALDAGIRRDSYWDVIAARFNDINVNVRFDSGFLDGVDESATPLCQRSATLLKDHFKKARADFTKSYEKWRASGQNDPDRFSHFLSYNNGQLYASSKRAYIIFLCCQLGAPYANTLLLDSITKSIANGGRDEGVTLPSNGSGGEASNAISRGQKRLRKSNASILEEIQDASKSIIEASSAVTKRFQQTNKQAASTMSLTQDESALHILNVKSKCYGELQAAYDNLQSAMNRGDPVLIKFAQASFDEAKKVCEEVGKDSGGASDVGHT